MSGVQMSWEAIGALEYKKDKDPFPTKPNLHRGYPKALFWILEGINRVIIAILMKFWPEFSWYSLEIKTRPIAASLKPISLLITR